MNSKRTLTKLICVILAELLLVVMVVWFFDPFYQYHKPFFGMKAVLNDRDNQVPGSIRTFDYDAVLVGSSVAECFDTGYLDEQFGCTTLKVIKASGTTADLLYYMDMVHDNQEINTVFYCLDISVFMYSTETELITDKYPRYLHTKNILDDWKYVFNKDVLFEIIPKNLALAKAGRNVGGDAYNWSRDKEFGAEAVKRAYEKPEVNAEPKDFSEDISIIEANIANLCNEVESHPDITYYFCMPAYSMAWWDCSVASGLYEEYIYEIRNSVSALLEYDNVYVYDYQVWEDVVCDLDNYMDMIHYTPAVNQMMLEAMVNDENRVTRENLEYYIEKTESMVEKITTTEIYKNY